MRNHYDYGRERKESCETGVEGLRGEEMRRGEGRRKEHSIQRYSVMDKRKRYSVMVEDGKYTSAYRNAERDVYTIPLPLPG